MEEKDVEILKDMLTALSDFFSGKGGIITQVEYDAKSKNSSGRIGKINMI